MNTETPAAACRIVFEYKGQQHTLTKHPTVRQALKAGTITPQDAILRPWYLRPSWRANRPFKLSADDADAIRAAKDILKGRVERPEQFSAWLEEQDARRGVTLGQLATEWQAAGLPYSKTEPRHDAAAAALRATLARALPWWQDKRPAAITTNDHEDYVVHRRQHVRKTSRSDGNRSADLELSCLSSLCQWAMKLGKLEANPFADRQRYTAAETVHHCHEFAPETDEELHRLLAWFFTRTYQQEDLSNRHKAAHVAQVTRCAGAWLAFTALTGLRPEEPAYLYRWPRLATPPGRPATLAAGTIFPDRTGAWKMKVTRTKHGQNPYVNLPTIALDFLDVWTTWCDANLPRPEAGAPAWFPNPQQPHRPLCAIGETTLLNKRVAQACAELQLPERKPKGIGRAFYVAVRRSAGLDDATIAGELGQTTNGKLIWSVYGNPDDLRGGALLDWIPEANGQPAPYAWTALQTNIQTNTGSDWLKNKAFPRRHPAHAIVDAITLAQELREQIILDREQSLETYELVHGKKISDLPPDN